MSGHGQYQSAAEPAGKSLRSTCLAAIGFGLACVGVSSALAHGSERGIVLLLPTGYYLVGGTLAVAASFVLINLIPLRRAERLARARILLGTMPAVSSVPASLATFLLLAFLLATGIYGSRDPLENPLPLTIWTLWWVGVTLLHAVVGNLWSFINPWRGPCWLADRVARGRLPHLRYPDWLGYWPAVVLFFSFAWFELVYPAPDDPEKLAIAVAAYWATAFLGMLVFGERQWAERGEPFSIFFRLVGALSPLVIEKVERGRVAYSLGWPGTSMLERDALPSSGVFFVLLTLSSVSFDGLSRTFWWLGLGGINPLEYPGRTAVVDRNTMGLLIALAALAILYWTAVRLGWSLGGMRARLKTALGSFVYSIIPISIAFHFSHYLTTLLVNGQYALIAASDPFGTGRDLLGLGQTHVSVSFLSVLEGVRLIWYLQTAAIVLGHVAGIVLAHLIAFRKVGKGQSGAAIQIPLAVLMVIYTLFGLWLLSTPVVG
jgi:hypothetical protein